MMKKVFVALAAVAQLCLGVASQADVFSLGSGLTNMEMVRVGDVGNAADTRYSSPGIGSVGYSYHVGKFEVTAAQYTDFLNQKAKSDPYGLYSTAMDTAVDSYGCNIKRSGSAGSYSYSIASDWANRPVNFVSYWDSLRFANWLNNGQGDGDTETGAYTLNSYNGQDGGTIQRNAGAKWFLTSEDEWYKSAYYKSGGTDAGYWDYSTQSNTAPGNQIINPDPGNTANYYNNGYTIGSPYWRTDVGEFENSEGAYGTFDQGGNVWEWNEAIVGVAHRALRAGSFGGDGVNAGHAWARIEYSPTMENGDVGFRVAGAVPEPSSLVALSTGGLALLLSWRRRRA